jgi:DNA recombination protein RmuC
MDLFVFIVTALLTAILGGVSTYFYLNAQINELKTKKSQLENELANELENEKKTHQATQIHLTHHIDQLNDISQKLDEEKQKNQQLHNDLQLKSDHLITLTTEYKHVQQQLEKSQNTCLEITKQHHELQIQFKQKSEDLMSYKAQYESIKEQLEQQKLSQNQLNETFKTSFQNIANEVLAEKSQKFTQVNQESLHQILSPLNQELGSFKQKIEELYLQENKERFSLSERVKELTELNNEMSQEAKKLTQALKSEAKTQGQWGELILSTILEKSNLKKGEHYDLETQLTDEFGHALKSDQNKKMRPDAIIYYPDERCVIIDSKVSINAFIRSVEAQNDELERQKALSEHVLAVKKHIDTLSERGYDDYKHALDFTMMFMPNESAYIAAMQHDANLWEYAYKKRILLISPMNLIISCLLYTSDAADDATKV